MSGVDGALKQEVKQDLPALCKRARAGSVWCALLVAIEAEPRSFREFLCVLGVTGVHKGISGSRRVGEQAFDVACDAWRVYEDALTYDIAAA